MIVFTVVVCYSAGFVMARCLLDVGQSTLNQRQHIVRRFWVEHPPFAADGDVDRRGMRYDTAPPSVVVWNGLCIVGAAASCCNPRVFVHFQIRFQA